ncbi:MAG: hypothetical protein HETSPECPRED_003285 [Heterodermia speciosa]|uniref:Heterokaryon incompatibility domain-containing protein n=1 Tax=Heterodermia speciosa TaxID=116794 RepID=A0A8H3EEZ9_9LECA|nr:MAG: hypothetical protein HETSPECPRED_003285 [Heterodermia speciosa]
MRLLSTSTGELHEFFDEKTPPYAILSHTWGDGEVSFRDLERHDPDPTKMAGYSKIKSCCKLAASEGWKFVWIDTCCIDKSSSAELSEAINSMFRWYHRAAVCYAYLSDVDVEGEPHSSSSSICGSRWFTRGWTLQELLAPADVIFYDKNWTEIGTKRGLREEISSETGIQVFHLFYPMDACIAVKMSWASRRTTARREDIAYCLLGLFDLNMPLLYGEGEKAFFRLQYELLQSGGEDESILAWEDRAYQPSTFGLLAPSPAAFASSGNIETIDVHSSRHPLVSNLTKKSMLANVLMPADPSSGYPFSNPSSKPLVILHCKRQGEDDTCLGIAVTTHRREGYYIRHDPTTLTTCRASSDLRRSHQAKRSEKILLSYANMSPFGSSAERIIGVKWPALQIDPRIARMWSEREGFEMGYHFNDGCWAFKHADTIHKIAMTFASSEGECFSIVLQRGGNFFDEDVGIDVIIWDFVLVQEALQDSQISSRTREALYERQPPSQLAYKKYDYLEQDTFYGKLQQGSHLSVKLRKHSIDDHIRRTLCIDVSKNSSIFELKDIVFLRE